MPASVLDRPLARDPDIADGVRGLPLAGIQLLRSPRPNKGDSIDYGRLPVGPAVILLCPKLIHLHARLDITGEVGGEPAVGADGEQHLFDTLHALHKCAPALLAEVTDGDGFLQFSRYMLGRFDDRALHHDV